MKANPMKHARELLEKFGNFQDATEMAQGNAKLYGVGPEYRYWKLVVIALNRLCSERLARG